MDIMGIKQEVWVESIDLWGNFVWRLGCHGYSAEEDVMVCRGCWDCDRWVNFDTFWGNPLFWDCRYAKLLIFQYFVEKTPEMPHVNFDFNWNFLTVVYLDQYMYNRCTKLHRTFITLLWPISWLGITISFECSCILAVVCGVHWAVILSFGPHLSKNIRTIIVFLRFGVLGAQITRFHGSDVWIFWNLRPNMKDAGQ